MKILALRLENLASLPGPLELDFTAPPLADAGLFAITGPTGAGKSTLLDALCLALYGSTPRLRQAPSRDSQIDDTADSRLTTSDARTLLRRGTASGYAEVDFLGRDGRRYRSRWAVRRAREKATGRLQAAEQSLTDLDDERLLTAQKREFERLLPERLGLTFDQFTRAVLLAQSEFAAFLQADDNARSDLLERLTGTAEYSEISMAAYRRANEAKKAVDALETRLADDLPAEPEARAELDRAATATQQALTHLQTQAESLKTRRRWHDEDARLHADYVEGMARHQAAEADWQTLADRRADRDRRRLIAPRRQELTRQASLPGHIHEAEANRDATRQALARAQQAARDAADDHDRAGKRLEAASEARREAEPRLREAREHQHALAQRQRELAECEAQLTRSRAQAAKLGDDHRREQAAQEKRHEQQRRWQSDLAELVGEHSQLHAARQAIQQAHDRAAARQLDLGELQAAWREARQAEQAHRQLETRLAEANERLATLAHDGQAARRQLEACKARHDSLGAFIARARAARSESVAMLRDDLQEGEPCPVCGGLDHPWRRQPPASPEAAQLAAQQAEEERELDAAHRAHEQALNAHQALQAQYKLARDTRKQLEEEAPAARTRWTSARQALEAHPLHRELADVAAEERDGWLGQQRQRSAEARSTHQAHLERLQRAEAELAPLEESLRQGELALTRLEAEKAAAETQLAEREARLPELQRQHDDTERSLRTLLGDHATAEAWQQRLDDAEAQARQARETALARRHDAEREQQRLAQQLAHREEQLTALQQEQEQLARSLADWRAQHPDLDDATLARLLAQGDDEAREEEREIEAADQARQHAAATLAERHTALLRHRRGQGLIDGEQEGDDGEKHDVALLGETMAEALEHRLAALAEAQAELSPRLEAAQQARDEALHALRDDDRRRERQRAGQDELAAARAEYRRWGRISELIGSADGKVFRRIAQAYNLEQLLEHANTHLAGLSRRYRLARGGSPLGLLVVDQDMADERRSVHSLSGGETFLVSLALALGLASMASGELTIESLFIDEGFGSLDPQSLALAMEALDGLQALGRRVGVISHVQEMHERIPVQIRVEPLGNGTSRACIVSG
ncbi:exonuclease SbcC [Halomonas campaniensis]|uniref:Nuclease SbcCD subunit C n=1 Tax=Halomonas campaniensis TaxID=213554 RepID=A0A7W5K3M6_9GAMM|nr:AAA family ATPase [Halomonas campaniensis]MBB3331329.1 exonuclease SbcC [Halomonas campaniensis]